MIKDQEKTNEEYEKPLLKLLEKSGSAPCDLSELGERVKKLQEAFERLRVNAKIIAVFPGPAITGFEFSLPNKTGVSRINEHIEVIEHDLGVYKIRVVDYWRDGERRVPVGGEDCGSFVTVCGQELCVTLEIPNPKPCAVPLGDILNSPEFGLSPSLLPLALGKNARGGKAVCALEETPHLLIGGMTGSGKSCCIHSFILSLICKNSPSDVRLILIDMKRAEFYEYGGLPHLLTPDIIVEAQHAANALKWAEKEMTRRFDMFWKAGASNIEGYSRLGAEAEKLPYIVIIIDELADLMHVKKRGVEDIIRRLTQTSRAAGLHLILATQRPSPDVVTGVIKANLPGRISLRMTSCADSKTILNECGAERLLGCGDMLFYSPRAAKSERIQGCYVSHKEICAVTDYIKQNNTAGFDGDIVSSIFCDAGEL